MSRYVVTVGTVELCALMDAMSGALAAVIAITPPADDAVQTEAVVSARCAMLAAMRRLKEMENGPVQVEP